MATSSNARHKARLSEIQKQNICTLITDIQNSVDAPPLESSVADLKSPLKAALVTAIPTNS